MRIRLTEEQEGFREEVQGFTSQIDSSSPVFASVDDQFAYLVDFERQLDAAGLAAVTWPVRYGGRGLTAVEYAIVCEELGRSRAPEVINFVGIDVIAPALLAHVDDARLSAWLPSMASADEIWCQLFSEPDSGSDLASLRTTATLQPPGWIIDGQKVWSTWAQYASWGVLLARTGVPEDRHRGISAFVVNMATPGIETRPLKTMTGSVEFAEVFFDNVELPPEALIGKVGGGWEVTQAILTAERGPYAIRRSAVLRGALTGLYELASGSNNPLIRRQLVEATMAMELLDLRIADVVKTLCRNEPIGAESALTKLLLGQTEQVIFAVAMEVLGVQAIAPWHRVVETSHWIEQYLYSRASTIYGGSQQIQRNIVGERLLGLPR